MFDSMLKAHCSPVKYTLKIILICIIFMCAIWPFGGALFAQEDEMAIQVSQLISEYRADRRGPYLDIKWFCDDSTMREAKDPCPDEIGGVQHARYKYPILTLRQKYHLFLDQILTGTEFYQFWDYPHHHSRVNQYLITDYLRGIDNGWILEKGQYYRGSKQIEDEKKWGQEFLEWLVSDQNRLSNNFLTIRQICRRLPHGEESKVLEDIRIYSMLLGNARPDFMDIRTRIHNDPQRSNLFDTQKWLDQYRAQLSEKELEYALLLLENLQSYYLTTGIEEVIRQMDQLPNSSQVCDGVYEFIEELNAPKSSTGQLGLQLLSEIRQAIESSKSPKDRVAYFDLSIVLENRLLSILSTAYSDVEKHLKVEGRTMLSSYRDHFCHLIEGVYGAGYIESWERDFLTKELDWLYGQKVNLKELSDYNQSVTKVLAWAISNLQSGFDEDLSLYRRFEPKVEGFLDNELRSTILLNYSQLLTAFKNHFNGLANVQRTYITGRGDEIIQGLNAGFAKGELVVITDKETIIEEDVTKIYAFHTPPKDLKPVAGILNVTEGNPLSHVQLLARNLGIPNAVLSGSLLEDLKKYNGQEVFYAVSPKGAVVLKLAAEMTEEETRLFEDKRQNQNRFHIPTDKLNLKPDTLLDLKHIRSSHSGKWCGPKAANLGQLKSFFPEHVVEGVVIPFGVFKDHMDQEIPGLGESYWTFLRRIFKDKERMKANNIDAKEIDCIVLQELGMLRDHILNMPLKPTLVRQLEKSFREVMGESLGKLPVFLRSDTNMEDLPNFSGAGLNLTLFNVVSKEKILHGIKQVWASPYSERSYQWRQQLLSNPEEVYPSILIIPSVNVDKSGVIITTGLGNGTKEDITVSFSKGVGGAVDGQMAETYLIRKNGYEQLVMPLRETKYRTIPPSGGSKFEYVKERQPLLNKGERRALKDMADKIKTTMDEVSRKDDVYDIELGILGEKLWLFQVRPFVENDESTAANYLSKIDPELSETLIDLDP